jgi:hypothetical protein
MPPHIRLLNGGFSTADGDFATFDFNDHQYVRFSFVDWREETVCLLFKNVVALRWQTAEELLPGEPYDGSCEIVDSPWLAMHLHQGVIDSDVQYHYYKFSLNPCGSFEVICSGYRLENDRKYAKGVWDT